MHIIFALNYSIMMLCVTCHRCTSPCIVLTERWICILNIMETAFM